METTPSSIGDRISRRDMRIYTVGQSVETQRKGHRVGWGDEPSTVEMMGPTVTIVL